MGLPVGAAGGPWGGTYPVRGRSYRPQAAAPEIPHATPTPKNCCSGNVSADKVPINEQERQIYNYALENPSITTTQTATSLNIRHRPSDFQAGIFFCRNMVFLLLSWYNRCKNHFFGKTSCRPIYRTPIVVKSGCPPITKTRSNVCQTIRSPP